MLHLVVAVVFTIISYVRTLYHGSKVVYKIGLVLGGVREVIK